MKFNSRLLVFTLILITLTTACKLIFGPKLGWSGFSPVIAIALFSGMIVTDKSKSFLLPLIAVFASDVLIEIFHRLSWFPYAGFYSHQWVNYSLLLLATLIGWGFKGKNYSRLFAGAIAAPTVFFLLSNFSVWLSDTHQVYARNIAGLMECYTAGLPFYRNALVATLLFLPAIVIAYNYLVKRRAAFTLA